MFCVDQAFGQAATNLQEVLGSRFSVDTIETINKRLGIAAGDFLDDLPEPDPDSEAKLLVASADGKGVPLIKEEAAKVAACETAKKNPGNRKMATVASVYSVDPHVRTAEEIADALFREEVDAPQDSKPQRPKPQNKNTTAHFPVSKEDATGNAIVLSGIQMAMTWIMGQINIRRRANQVLVVLMDGQESLWSCFERCLPFSVRTVGVLDILHAMSYVWKASHLFCDDDAERMSFTRARLLRILRGDVPAVVRGLRQIGTVRKLKGDPLASLNQICGYLEKNACRMRYDEYLRRGYPIASGLHRRRLPSSSERPDGAQRYALDTGGRTQHVTCTSRISERFLASVSRPSDHNHNKANPSPRLITEQLHPHDTSRVDGGSPVTPAELEQFRRDDDSNA